MRAPRLAAYRELFRYELEPGLVDEIRRTTNGNFALGNERFAAQVSSALGRRAAQGNPDGHGKGQNRTPECCSTTRTVVCPLFPRAIPVNTRFSYNLRGEIYGTV